MVLDAPPGPVPAGLWNSRICGIPPLRGASGHQYSATSRTDEDFPPECRCRPPDDQSLCPVPAGCAAGVGSPAGWELHKMGAGIHTRTGDSRSLVDSDPVGAWGTRLRLRRGRREMDGRSSRPCSRRRFRRRGCVHLYLAAVQRHHGTAGCRRHERRRRHRHRPVRSRR